MTTNSPADPGDWLAVFVGQLVVCDLAEPYLVIGRLESCGPDHLAFAEADLHDHREANSTKEVYALESRQLGVRANRRRVTVPRRQLVAISRLDDLVA
jgi:hypothetical protein